MSDIMWLTMGLIAFDAILLTMLGYSLRHCTPLSSQGLVVTAAALSGFVFHALIFFSGVLLVIQLTAIVGVFCICMLVPRKQVHEK